MPETLPSRSLSEMKDQRLEIFAICRCGPARVATAGKQLLDAELVKVSVSGWMIRNLERAK
jgi:hypothetical protein